MILMNRISKAWNGMAAATTAQNGNAIWTFVVLMPSRGRKGSCNKRYTRPAQAANQQAQSKIPK
jgi:hypothetical protein